MGKPTQEGKQTLLVRLYSRTNVDHVLRIKKCLKGTGYIVYEDAPMLSRLLINALKPYPGVNSAWYSNGTVWAKKTADGPKFKVGVRDSIALVLAAN